MVTIPLIGQLSDINNNIDLSTLEVLIQPISGAFASIDQANNLIVDYTNITFSGMDQLTVRVCDFLGACSDVVVMINIAEIPNSPITVYNAVSPNGDGKHDFLEIENIEQYPDNLVTLFNRWGDVVYQVSGYNNADISFTGKGNGNSELTSGTYYYSIDLNTDESIITGFVMLSN